MTLEQLQRCLPKATHENIQKFGPKLLEAMVKYDINTPRREAVFIAQIAHESGSLRYVEELASGDTYEGRKDLGNIVEGDGKRFKGRGLIQITGRVNYKLVGQELQYDFITNPEALEWPGPATYSAAWFFWYHRLNRLSDIDAFEKVTRRINGGVNGMEDRLKHYERCKEVLGVEAIEVTPKSI